MPWCTRLENFPFWAFLRPQTHQRCERMTFYNANCFVGAFVCAWSVTIYSCQSYIFFSIYKPCFFEYLQFVLSASTHKHKRTPLNSLKSSIYNFAYGNTYKINNIFYVNCSFVSCILSYKWHYVKAGECSCSCLLFHFMQLGFIPDI